MNRRLSVVSLLLGVALTLACGSGASDIASVVRSKASWYAPQRTAFNLASDLELPPDRAVLPGQIAVEANSADAATQRIRDEVAALDEALAPTEVCRARWIDYRPAEEHERGRWTALVAVDVDVDLEDADLPTRMQRLDACLAAWRAHASLEAPDGVERALSMGPPAVVVDDVEQAAPELLARRARSAQQLLAAAGGPLHPEDRRCVPTGVQVVETALAAVVVRLTEECRVVAPAPPPEG